MKIAFFTPLERDSAVGHHSVAVAEALAGLGHAVELWAPERRGELHPTRLAVVRFRRRPAALTRLAQTDFAVYALGNHPTKHGAIHDVAMRHPGIVVLHDLVLHHMLLVRVARGELPALDYLAAIEAEQGRAARDEARAHVLGAGALLTDERAARQPLFSAALQRALGVVCHSAWQARAVRARWPGPVRTLLLPHDLDDEPGAAVAPRRRSEPLRLLSIGDVNSNKRVGDVVELLARRPDLAARVRYDVIGKLHGALPHTTALRERIAALGLQDRVRLHGRLGDRELAAALR
ncbi:MAG: hypothetical protein QOJ63_677, partial [Solirubrobacteraceae bacterium]|nr:hypothetical protein [Solirubrobacteraceae bacterium]